MLLLFLGGGRRSSKIKSVLFIFIKKIKNKNIREKHESLRKTSFPLKCMVIENPIPVDNLTVMRCVF